MCYCHFQHNLIRLTLEISVAIMSEVICNNNNQGFIFCVYYLKAAIVTSHIKHTPLFGVLWRTEHKYWVALNYFCKNTDWSTSKMNISIYRSLLICFKVEILYLKILQNNSLDVSFDIPKTSLENLLATTKHWLELLYFLHQINQLNFFDEIMFTILIPDNFINLRNLKYNCVANLQDSKF